MFVPRFSIAFKSGILGANADERRMLPPKITAPVTAIAKAEVNPRAVPTPVPIPTKMLNIKFPTGGIISS